MSRLIAAQYLGINCPIKANINRVLGTSPGLCTIDFDGETSIPVGQQHSIQIASVFFSGIIQRITTDYQERVGVTTIQMVDWRDRLQDKHIYASFNMVEEDGRWYHIFPGDDWTLQRKLFLKREVQKNSWGQIQNIGVVDPQYTDIKDAVQLLSSATILNILAEMFQFSWTASDTAYRILQTCYIENVDWNRGELASNALESILSRSRLQFTALGRDQIYISMRGVSDNATDPTVFQACINGMSTLKSGYEVNQKGRRAIIVGGFNQHELIFPCIPDWNPKWTYKFCYSGWYQSAFLRANKLSLISKLNAMPVEYQDFHTFGGKSRNLMTIKEYLETICWRMFVVNPNYAICLKDKTAYQHFAKDPTVRFIGGFDLNPDFAVFGVDTLNAFDTIVKLNKTNIVVDNPVLYTGNWNDKQVPKVSKDYQQTILPPTKSTKYNDRDNIAYIGSYYPLSKHLVSDSGHKSIVYATSRRIPRSDTPFTSQINFVPKDEGINVDQEEVISVADGRTYYRWTVHFSEPQYRVDPKKPIFDITGIMLDHIAVMISFDTDLYRYVAGDMTESFMVREKKKDLNVLRKCYIDEFEVEMLYQNYASPYAANNGPVPAADLVNADDLASQITAQMLNHQVIVESGSFHLLRVFGYIPDGVVESTQIQYDGQYNLTDEQVNVTSELLDIDLVMSTSDYQVDTTRAFHREGRLTQLALLENDRSMVEKSGVGKAMQARDQNLNNPGAFIGGAKLANANAEDHQVNAVVPAVAIQGGNAKLLTGQIVMLTNSIDVSYNIKS